MNKAKEIVWFIRNIKNIGKIQLCCYRYGDRGKRKVLLLGMHGDELTPYYIVSNYLNKNKFIDFTLDIIPVINVGGLLTGKRMDLLYGLNYNRFYNNSSINFITEINSALYKFIEDADLIIDMHNWDSPSSIFGICFNNLGLNDKTYLNTYSTIGVNLVLDNSLINEFNESLGTKINSIKYFPVEYPNQNYVNSAIIKRLSDNLSNTLNERFIQKSPIIIQEKDSIISNEMGVLNVCIKPGEFIHEGSMVAELIDPFSGFEKYTIKSKKDGYILYFENSKFVLPGDVIMVIGTSK